MMLTVMDSFTADMNTHLDMYEEDLGLSGVSLKQQ